MRSLEEIQSGDAFLALLRNSMFDFAVYAEYDDGFGAGPSESQVDYLSRFFDPDHWASMVRNGSVAWLHAKITSENRKRTQVPTFNDRVITMSAQVERRLALIVGVATILYIIAVFVL